MSSTAPSARWMVSAQPKEPSVRPETTPWSASVDTAAWWKGSIWLQSVKSAAVICFQP